MGKRHRCKDGAHIALEHILRLRGKSAHRTGWLHTPGLRTTLLAGNLRRRSRLRVHNQIVCSRVCRHPFDKRSHHHTDHLHRVPDKRLRRNEAPLGKTPIRRSPRRSLHLAHCTPLL